MTWSLLHGDVNVSEMSFFYVFIIKLKKGQRYSGSRVTFDRLSTFSLPDFSRKIKRGWGRKKS